MRGTLSTELGEMILDTNEAGLTACGTWVARPAPPDDSRAARRHLELARAALAEYLAGTRRSFAELTLAAIGTPFQQAVWRGLTELRYGETLSYAALARRLGRPGAARAVGRANATNPLAIVQPCHRVLGVGGQLVGFAGGLPMKHWLLQHEKRVLEQGS